MVCVGAVAVGCPAGFVESLDCNNLLEGNGGCNAAVARRNWDVSGACKPAGASCTPHCNTDGGVVGCMGTNQIEVGCAAYGLKSCISPTRLSATTAQCAPP